MKESDVKQYKKFFLSHFTKGKRSECWLWFGAQTRRRGKIFGYGSFGIKGKIQLAHRVSYILQYGNFNQKLFVLHKCDNPPCVNPYHLWLGTNQDNVDDMMKKGRDYRGHVNGIKHGMCKLKEKEVLKIRKIGKSQSQQKIATKFNVSRRLIGLIIQRKIWKHI